MLIIGASLKQSGAGGRAHLRRGGSGLPGSAGIGRPKDPLSLSARMLRILFICLPLLLCALLAGCGSGRTQAAVPPQVTAPAVSSPAEPASGAAAVSVTGADGRVCATVSYSQPVSERAGQVSVAYLIRNETELSLTLLRFELNCLDTGGSPLNRTPLPLTLSFLEEPLKPGELREVRRIHYFTGAEQTVSLVLTPLQALDEREMPPWNEPRPHSLLPVFCNDEQLAARFDALDTDLPVLLRYDRDQEGTLEIRDPELIRAAADALSQLRVGDVSERNVDDGGFGFTFVMADGSEWSFRFDFRDLFYWHGKNYDVEDASALQALRLDLREQD